MDFRRPHPIENANIDKVWNLAILFLTLSVVVVDKSVVTGHLHHRQVHCQSQCNFVLGLTTVCPTVSPFCFCPTFLADGPGCSACMATVSPSFASALGAVLTACVNSDSSPTPAPTPVGT